MIKLNTIFMMVLVFITLASLAVALPVEAPVNMEEESHGPTQVAPAVASPVPMDFDKISRRATWRDRKTRAVRANIRKRYYEMKNAIVGR